MGRENNNRAPSRGGRGSSGRGRATGSTNKQKKTSKSSNTQLEAKFHPVVLGQGHKQMPYQQIKDTILKKIQKSYKDSEDVVKSLKTGTKVDLQALKPVRQRSQQANKEDKEFEQQTLDMEYQVLLKQWSDRNKMLEANMLRAYADIWKDHMTKAMQQRVEEHPEYSSKIDDNPIKLLEAVQQLMHDPSRKQFPFATVNRMYWRVLGCKQQEDEDLTDYTKRFINEMNAFESTIGKNTMNDFIKQLPDYTNGTDEAKANLLQIAHPSWMTYTYLNNADKSKYGSLLATLAESFSLGTDNYPKTITAATDALSAHPFDQAWRDKKKKQRQQAQQSNQSNRSSNQQQPQPAESQATSFAQSGTGPTCYCCGQKGHKSVDCPKKDSTPKAQWYIKRAMNHLQEAEAAAPTDGSVATNNPTAGNSRSGTPTPPQTITTPHWSAFQSNTQQQLPPGYQLNPQTGLPGRPGVDFFQSGHAIQLKQAGAPTDYKDQIILDSGSTIGATFMNPDLMMGIRPSQRPLYMSTNAGSKELKHEGEVPGFGMAYYDPTHIANIFGLNEMTKKYRVTFDSAVDNAFYVHMPDGPRTFRATPEGLYAYTPTDGYKAATKAANTGPTGPGVTRTTAPTTTGPNPTLGDQQHIVTTVKENKVPFTTRQIADAASARKLYHILGCSSVENFKYILKANMIKNCPVTSTDVDVAEKIYGPDMGTLKGKTTRKKPVPVKDDLVEIPPEIKSQHKNLTLDIDVMYVNGMPFLTAIDKSIRYRSAVPLANRTSKSLYTAIDKIFRHYNKSGFTITDMNIDNEFKPIMDPIKDELGINMNYTTEGEHVPAAERNNRTIEEHIRAIYHNLPYKAIPRVMLRALTLQSTEALNFFPAKGGVSSYYSPRTIMKGEALDYTKHCRFPFGAYVQASQNNNPTNTNAPRTTDAIYLRPLYNKQGGHLLMHLPTGREITRNHLKELPVTDTVIKAVEALAESDGIKTLKITGKNKQPIYPANWIAGVDYEPQNQNNDEEDDVNDDNYDDVPDLLPRTAQDLDSDDEDDLDDDELYDRVDQQEIDELLAESTGTASNSSTNPIANEDGGLAGGEQAQAAPTMIDDTSSHSSEEQQAVRRSTRANAGQRSLYDPSTGLAQVTKNIGWVDQHLVTDDQPHPNPTLDDEYDVNMAPVIARLMIDMHQRVKALGAKAFSHRLNGRSFGQQYILQKGLKKFGPQGRAAAYKELEQQHNRECFEPIRVADLTPEERRKAQEALMFLNQKRDGSIKGRAVYNGKPTREWMSRDDTASPTASLESIFITAIIDAVEGRDIMSADIPNAFIQAFMPTPEEGCARVVMKITGVLVDMLLEIAPEVYGPYVVYENGRKVLYVQVLRALYGMLVSALLWYKQFRSDLESYGFVFNPYDPCVANKIVDGTQHTIRFHVDDLKSSHMKAKVNDLFLKWLNEKYGKFGEVKATRGKIHDYLGMTFDFTDPGKVKVDMCEYMSSMVDEWPGGIKPGDTAPTPATTDLFNVAEDSPPLPKPMAEDFHTFVAKGLFACKRARPDIHTAIATLCTRTKSPTEDDARKLLRLLRYINGTRDHKLILSAENLEVIHWYVDASFAVHPDMKSHTGAVMTFGGGAVQSISRKQKLNTTSSTYAELVAAHDASTMILWTKLFMEAQGYPIRRNILQQDNKSTILLLNNGKLSSSKRTRAIDIRYFFLTDQIQKGNLETLYCPTDKMLGDYMSKPLQGKPFYELKPQVMGHT